MSVSPGCNLLRTSDRTGSTGRRARGRWRSAATGRTGVGDDEADQLAAAMTSAMAAGDGGAVEAFYRRYFDRLYAEARRATRRDESFCLDVVQESVLRIVRTVRGATARSSSWHGCGWSCARRRTT